LGKFTKMGILAGATSSYMTQIKTKDEEGQLALMIAQMVETESHTNFEEDENDGGPILGGPIGAMSLALYQLAAFIH